MKREWKFGEISLVGLKRHKRTYILFCQSLLWLMLKTYILQVLGRFSGYEELDIKVVDKTITTKLVCEAIKKAVVEDAEIILYVPESLIILLIDDFEEVLDYLRNIQSLEKLFKEEVLNSNLLGEDFKLRVIKSAGLYREKSNRYKLYFDNSLNNIIIYLFLDLLTFRDARIIADISTGQNFYVIALLEALRHILTYRKLENIFNREWRTEITLSTIPPVIESGSNKRTPRLVNFSELDVKVFFEYPLKTITERRKTLISLGDFISQELDEDRRVQKIGELIEKFGRDFKKIKEILQLCKISFNAIKYNAPLCFYEPEIINLKKYDVDEALNLLKRILEYVEEERRISIGEDNNVKIERTPLARTTIINTFLTISLFKSIRESLNHLNTKRNPTLTELRGSFDKIYSILGLQLNQTFLQREINNIIRVSDNLKDGEEKLYGELLGEQPGRPQDPKRNFFAHAGLTYDTVLVRKELGEVRVRYEEEQFKKIREYLSRPL